MIYGWVMCKVKKKKEAIKAILKIKLMANALLFPLCLQPSATRSGCSQSIVSCFLLLLLF